MLEELAKAYREACEESSAASIALRALAEQQDAASKRLKDASEKRMNALDALTEYIRTQPAPVPPGSAE